ncbi:hypothetical protein BJX63DRAFT_420535 [Aspergillus granulosus]|uniref:Actin-like ATPase domain-containing protein n=1 Tax=Aspergillus granulosus TaxID=176169 RepID=A0ABR4HIM3_9EURO
MAKENSPSIIGIDFGARSSSAAFALDKATRRPLDQFPTSAEVESIVYYDMGLKVVGWSQDSDEIVSPEGRLKGGLYVMADFKSRLYPPEDYPEELQAVTLMRDKTEVDIAMDYLGQLRQSVLAQVESQVEKLGSAKRTFQVMMTTPAFWNEEAKAKFREIARNAGFMAELDEKLEFVSTLEAAVLHAEYRDPPTFAVGKTFIVVDCGGSLVEAAAFEIKEKNPLRLERQTRVSVASCGSTEVTRRFMKVANSKLDRIRFRELGRTKPRMRHRCKRQFEKEVLIGLGTTAFRVLPEALSSFWVADLMVEFDCPEADLVEGYMSFREDEVYPCFDFAIERTLGVVYDQITALQGQDQQTNGCLLVGGFNNCLYYNRKVQTGIRSYSLAIIQPDYDPVAFAKGAVLSGLNGL